MSSECGIFKLSYIQNKLEYEWTLKITKHRSAFHVLKAENLESFFQFLTLNLGGLLYSHMAK